ncbi:MAG: prepilin-type N-terminal cleavage/methylation domain-containing protein [Thermoleophilia bacterium]|nr:prepilin-type N-terminal cleavage/methylation domain-containing protein [Thermoleophilia bacterium]
MPQRTRRATQGGFSFIEVLIGIMILGIVAGGVLMGFSASQAQTARAKMDTIASKIASGELETVRAMEYDDVGNPGGNPDGTIPATSNQTVNDITYRVDTDVAYVDDPTPGRARNYINYKKVTVTVTPSAKVTGPVVMSALVAPPNAGAIRGKATAIITVQDSLTGQILPGVPVRLFGSTSTERVAPTGADGSVVFAGLDPSDPNTGSSRYYYRAAATLAGYNTDPDTADVKQSLAASQTWNATIKLYRPAHIVVNVRDKATGQFVTRRTQTRVTLPAPQALSQTFVGYTGRFPIDTIQGEPIRPSLTPTTVEVFSDCYVPATVPPVPVPQGYPASDTQVFDVDLEPVARTGVLRVWVKRAGTTTPITNAQVVVSGGEQSVTYPIRDVDANGYADFCLPKSTSALYTVSVVGKGYTGYSIVTAVPEGATVDQTLEMGTTALCQVAIKHRLSGGQQIRLVGVGATAPYDMVRATNSSQVATFGSLSPGTYNVQVVSGYSGSQPVWVSAGSVPGLVNGNINCPSSVVPVVG